MATKEEEIYKFSDALDLRRDPKESTPKFKYSELLEFRNMLRDYSAEVNKNNIDNPVESDVYMKCLIDASYDIRPAIYDSSQNILASLAGAVVMPFILKDSIKQILMSLPIVLSLGLQ